MTAFWGTGCAPGVHPHSDGPRRHLAAVRERLTKLKDEGFINHAFARRRGIGGCTSPMQPGLLRPAGAPPPATPARSG